MNMLSSDDLPVKAWIHEIYEKRQEKTAKKKARKEQATAACSVADTNQLPEDSTTYLDEEEFILEDDDLPDSQDIQEENQAMLGRQEQFRIAAQYVADSLSSIPKVQKAVLFGSGNMSDKSVPEVEEFAVHFYEEGITSIETVLRMRQIMACEHWKGNTDCTLFDVIKRAISR